MERIGRRVVAWSLLGIAVTVTYCWCVRISNDLNWDEAGSLKRYAQHPLTAAAYIHDSNNHPLDSFFRSIFFRVLGLDSPPFWRFAGFVILLGFLAVVVALVRRARRPPDSTSPRRSSCFSSF